MHATRATAQSTNGSIKMGVGQFGEIAPALSAAGVLILTAVLLGITAKVRRRARN